MKIINLKINEFGKLKNKEIQLQNKINIIYGKNESGKSTLLKFIISMLYGLSKNKNGKEITDYEKYTPWEGENFSGKIKYELDDQKQYEVYREFKKKNPKIFNENLEDISQEFNIDKTKGNQFFYEQTKVDEQLFLSTIVAEQESLKLEEKEQITLVQKLSNLAYTGEDNLSFQKIINKLNKKQLEEIGTSKSQDRPINIIIRNIEKLEKEKEYLQQYHNKKYEIEEIRKKVKEEIKQEEKILKIEYKIKEIKNQYELEQEKLKINKQEASNLKEQIEELNIQRKNIVENKKTEKNNNIKIILIPIFIVLIILLNILISNNIIKSVGVLFTIVYTIVVVYLSEKEKTRRKKEKKQDEQNKEKIKNQIEILENKRKEQLQQILIIENRIATTLNLEKETIKNTVEIEQTKIEELLKQNNIEEQITKTQNNINDIKLKMHKLELDYNNILPKLENLSKIEEELIVQKQYYNELQKYNNSIKIAKEEIEKAEQEMKKNIIPKFAIKLSQIIEKISNGKYKNVQFNDEKGIIVEIENGNYINAQNLSIGTIDQLYLALRLSTIEEISEEKLPILLDEAFAYFDSDRLENILKYLNEQYNNRQVIIFTCTDREKILLEKLNITYNLIEC